MNNVDERNIIDNFHMLYYTKKAQTWGNTYWHGIPIQKCPLDLWIYQEIIHKIRPDLVIECGTADGGSALYLASILELEGNGSVLTIDVKTSSQQSTHNRVQYLVGSSISEEIVQQVKNFARGKEQILVILDSDHQAEHVLKEMRIYSQLVSLGSYLIVEDTNLNGHPVVPSFGPGPGEAVLQFLTEDNRFMVDLDCEKFMITANPGGYLKRVS